MCNMSVQIEVITYEWCIFQFPRKKNIHVFLKNGVKTFHSGMIESSPIVW